MIWARRRFNWAEYATYQDRIGELQEATPALQLQQQFIMVDVETGEPGVSDHYIGLPNQAFLAAFDGFEIVSEAQLPKEIDGVSVAIESEEFTSRFRLRSHDDRQRLRRERLAQRRRERAGDTTMGNITMPGVTHKEEHYKGFIISWQEPPMIGGTWSANVATNSPQLLALMGRNGAEVIQAQNRDEMLAKAKQYIDRLLPK
jgi:hypothetical protein